MQLPVPLTYHTVIFLMIYVSVNVKHYGDELELVLNIRGRVGVRDQKILR